MSGFKICRRNNVAYSSATPENLRHRNIEACFWRIITLDIPVKFMSIRNLGAKRTERAAVDRLAETGTKNFFRGVEKDDKEEEREQKLKCRVLLKKIIITTSYHKNHPNNTKNNSNKTTTITTMSISRLWCNN